MFDIGFSELALLAVLGLLVLGPERLPRVARTLGAYSRKARQAWRQIHTEIERELDAKDVNKALEESRETLSQVQRKTRAAMDDLNDTLKQRVDEQPARPGAGTDRPDNG